MNTNKLSRTLNLVTLLAGCGIGYAQHSVEASEDSKSHQTFPQKIAHSSSSTTAKATSNSAAELLEAYKQNVLFFESSETAKLSAALTVKNASSKEAKLLSAIKPYYWGKFQDSKNALLTLKKTLPNEPLIDAFLANCEAKLGKAAEGEKLAKAALLKYPKDISLRLAQAYTVLRQGKTAEAITLYSAISKDVKVAAAYRSHAAAQCALAKRVQGKPQEAIVHLRFAQQQRWNIATQMDLIRLLAADNQLDAAEKEEDLLSKTVKDAKYKGIKKYLDSLVNEANFINLLKLTENIIRDPKGDAIRATIVLSLAEGRFDRMPISAKRRDLLRLNYVSTMLARFHYTWGIEQGKTGTRGYGIKFREVHLK